MQLRRKFFSINVALLTISRQIDMPHIYTSIVVKDLKKSSIYFIISLSFPHHLISVNVIPTPSYRIRW